MKQAPFAGGDKGGIKGSGVFSIGRRREKRQERNRGRNAFPRRRIYDDEAGQTGVAKHLRLSDMIYRGGRHVEYGYGTADAIDDIMSRLATITDNTGADVRYKHLGLGTIVEEDNVESQTKLTYLDSSGDVSGLDRFGRIVDQLWEHYTLDGNGHEVPDLTPLDEYTYTYDRSGNRTSKLNALDHDLDEKYVYDDLGRLKEWDLWSVAQQDWLTQTTWLLDSLGNNIDETSGGDYNAANEQTSIAGSSVTPGYDAAGNMTTHSSDYTAKYDAWNRLVRVSDGESIVQENEYDGAGRRIQIFTNFDGQTPSGVDDDYYAGQQVTVAHHYSSGLFQGAEEYVWSPRYIDSPILRDSFGSDHSPIAGSRVLYLADANYSVTGLVKYDAGTQQWKVAERYTYTLYGEVTYRNANWDAYTDPNPQSLFSNTCLYTGRTLDTLTKLYYYRARFYDAALGRFVNRDPIGYAGGDVDLYRYVRSNPVSWLDPMGQARHHWFPQELLPRMSTLCGIFLKISKFTTELNQAQHDWLHNRNGFNYNDKVRQLLDEAADCCQFVLNMIALINNAYMESSLHSSASTTGPVPPLVFEPYFGVKPYPPNKTMPGEGLLNALLKAVCNDKNGPKRCPPNLRTMPAPKPMPIWVPNNPANDIYQDIGIGLGITVVVFGGAYFIIPASEAGTGGTIIKFPVTEIASKIAA